MVLEVSGFFLTGKKDLRLVETRMNQCGRTPDGDPGVRLAHE